MDVVFLECYKARLVFLLIGENAARLMEHANLNPSRVETQPADIIVTDSLCACDQCRRSRRRVRGQS